MLVSFVIALLIALSVSTPATAQKTASPTVEDPNEPMFLLNEAMSDYSSRHLFPARNRLEDLIKRYPKHPLARRGRLELGKILKDLREFDQAIEILMALATDERQDAEVASARELLLDLLFDLHRYKQGSDLLEGFWKANPGDVETGRRLARFYLSSGKINEAKLLLEGLLERTSRPDVFGDLLQMAIRQGKVEALRAIIEQRKARYRTADYLDFISDCLLAVKEDEKAATLLRESPETDTDIRLLRKLAQIDQARSEPARALETLRKLQKMFPEQWEYTKSAGHCLFQMGKKTEAVQEWRRHFQARGNFGTEGFQLYTEVLIEHKLYDEALAAFEEARRMFGIPTQFAEEKAGVLEALGRPKEALNEYFLTLANGLYKTEIFDKLYESASESFNLKEKLQEAIKKMPTLAVKRALLEVWFREEEMGCMPELLSMAANDGNVQEIVFERVRQQALARPTAFLRSLVLGLIRQDRASSLSLRLSLVFLTLIDQTDPEAEEALAEAVTEVDQEACPDLVLKNLLLIEAARLSFERFFRPKRALELLSRVTDGPAALAVPGTAFEAWLLAMHINAMLGDMPAASEALKKARETESGGIGRTGGPGETADNRSHPVTAPDDLDSINGLPMEVPPDDDSEGLFSPTVFGEESEARLLYEEGWLLAQEGQFQEALDKLKQLTATFPESLWMNDGLQLALLLTMGSIGDLDPLKKFFSAERAFQIGNATEAIDLMKGIAAVASGSFLGLDAKGRALLMAERVVEPKALKKEAEDFVNFHPAHWLAPDLLLLKIRLMNRTGDPAEALADSFKDFIDRFPGDLRSRRAHLSLAELMKAKIKAEKQ